MKEDWEIKKVSKQGSDYNIRIGPSNSIDEGIIPLMAAFVTTTAIMALFGLQGFAWFLSLFAVFCVFFAIFMSLATIGLCLTIVVLLVMMLASAFG